MAEWAKFQDTIVATLVAADGVLIGTTFIAVSITPEVSSDETLLHWAVFCGIIAFLLFVVSTIFGLLYYCSLTAGIWSWRYWLRHRDISTIMVGAGTFIGLVWLMAAVCFIVQLRIGRASNSALSATAVVLCGAALCVMIGTGLALLRVLGVNYARDNRADRRAPAVTRVVAAVAKAMLAANELAAGGLGLGAVPAAARLEEAAHSLACAVAPATTGEGIPWPRWLAAIAPDRPLPPACLASAQDATIRGGLATIGMAGVDPAARLAPSRAFEVMKAATRQLAAAAAEAAAQHLAGRQRVMADAAARLALQMAASAEDEEEAVLAVKALADEVHSLTGRADAQLLAEATQQLVEAILAAEPLFFPFVF